MSDTAPSTFDQADAAAAAAIGEPADPPAAQAPAEVQPAAAPPAPAGPSAAPEGVPDGKIAQLNRENQRYREMAREWESASQGWHPEDRKVILDTIALGATDPAAMANAFIQIAAQLQRAQADQAQQLQNEPPLTRTTLAEYMAEQEQQRAISSEAMRIEQEARQLGFSPEQNLDGYLAFLQYAGDHHGGDLQAAKGAMDAHLEKVKQATIEEYRKAKEGQASMIPTPSPDGSPGSSSQAPPMDFDEADRRTRELMGR